MQYYKNNIMARVTCDTLLYDIDYNSIELSSLYLIIFPSPSKWTSTNIILAAAMCFSVIKAKYRLSVIYFNEIILKVN